MAIFTKLFEISMVARRFLGLDFNSRIRLLIVLFSSSKTLSSFGLSEKKATSEPEMRPEQIMSMSNNKDMSPI